VVQYWCSSIQPFVLKSDQRIDIQFQISSIVFLWEFISVQHNNRYDLFFLRAPWSMFVWPLSRQIGEILKVGKLLVQLCGCLTASMVLLYVRSRLSSSREHILHIVQRKVKPSLDYLNTGILQPAPTNMGFSELFSFSLSGVCGNALCSKIPLMYVFREQIDTLNTVG